MRKYFVDLFAGCGGLSLGLENAGFMPVYVNELNEDALETYLLNRDSEFPHLRDKYHGRNIHEISKRSSALEKLQTQFKEDFGIKKKEENIERTKKR